MIAIKTEFPFSLAGGSVSNIGHVTTQRARASINNRKSQPYRAAHINLLSVPASAQFEGLPPIHLSTPTKNPGVVQKPRHGNINDSKTFTGGTHSDRRRRLMHNRDPISFIQFHAILLLQIISYVHVYVCMLYVHTQISSRLHGKNAVVFPPPEDISTAAERLTADIAHRNPLVY